MNVAELITLLQQLPPDTLVLKVGYEGNYYNIITPGPKTHFDVFPYAAPTWYRGDYCEVESCLDADDIEGPIVKAIIL